MNFYEKSKVNKLRILNKNLKRLYLYSAFTLAEVLITLGIIGVIAVITIPTIMQKTQELELKSRWIKAYAELSTASSQIITKYGGNLDITSITDGTKLRDEYLNYIKAGKVCNYADIKNTCWNNSGANSLGSNTIYPSAVWWSNFFNDSGGDKTSAIITNSGVSIIFVAMPATFHCDTNFVAFPECYRLYVDVNNFEPPNTWGKDIFWIFGYPNTAKPFGNDQGLNMLDDCNASNVSATGISCSAYYIIK